MLKKVEVYLFLERKYLFYLKFGDRQIIGSSPENLIRIQNNQIESYATLAGTK